MTKESDRSHSAVSAPGGPISAALPIRTRQPEVVCEPAGNNETHIDSTDKEQPSGSKGNSDTVELRLKDEEEPEKDETECKKKKKKKKKSKRTGGKKKNKPTGFEEYYADPPLTVAEFEENKSLYDPSLPAVQRLETAVQRYQVKRRMDSDRRNIFMKYMSYGGVAVGPKMFSGVDQKDLESLDAGEIMMARAQASITEDRSGWIVDFEAVAKGFLSSVLPFYCALDTEELARSSVNIVKNFLNYVLHHDVCPEYKENINAARAICDIAFKELWNTRRILNAGTGNFNTACSQLFGGVAYDLNANIDELDDPDTRPASMADDMARKFMKFALAGAGTYEQAMRFRNLANHNSLQAYPLDQHGFEVIDIIPADDGLRQFYHQYAPGLEPVGKIRAKPWHDPALGKLDLPSTEVEDHNVEEIPIEYGFFMEESLLKLYFVGMKVDATIWQLNCGVYYFDKIMSVHCSFYTTLQNDKMLGWKKPRELRCGELEAGEGDSDNDE